METLKLIISFFVMSLVFVCSYADSQVDALMALKNSLGDNNDRLGTWDDSFADPCGIWFHVHCDENGNVVSIDLSNENFSGHLVWDLSKLPHLRHLNLRNNQLTGPIPKAFENLHQLETLDLSYNDLTGPIPQGGNFNRFDPSAFAGNPNLCGPKLRKACP